MKNFLKKISYLLDILLLTIIAVCLISTVSVRFSTAGRCYDSIESIPHNHVGVLLGIMAHDKTGEYRQEFGNRVEVAAKLYKAGKIDIILISGANNIHRNEGNMPMEMRNVLIAKGVPDEDIYLDYEGHRTIRTVEKVRKVYGLDSVTFISQSGHNARALIMADHYGLNAVAFNACKASDFSQYLKSEIHEIAARPIMYYDLIFNDKFNFWEKNKRNYLE